MREGNPVDAGTPDTKRAAARWWWALSAIALVALVVRITFVLVWENPSPLAATRSSDAFYYHTVANFVADGRGFIYPFFLTPDAQHPPAYTLVLAGASILGFRTVLAHQIVSCLLGAVFVGVVGITGREIGGARVGLVAAALAAVYPGFWINDGLLMSESLAQLMVAIVLLLTYRALRVPTVARILLVGLACGLAALTRGELILLVPFAAVPLLVSARRRFGVHTLTLGVGVLVVVGATILPWSAYNLGRFDRPVLTSTQLGQTIAGANCPLTYDDPDWMGCGTPAALGSTSR